jgi:hypothetical protein
MSWIKFFLDAIYEQTCVTLLRVEQIEKLYKDLKERMPEVSSMYANSFLDAIFVKPTFTMRSIQEISKIANNQTLYTVIEKFVELTIIADITPDRVRNKIYSFSGLRRIIR